MNTPTWWDTGLCELTKHHEGQNLVRVVNGLTEHMGLFTLGDLSEWMESNALESLPGATGQTLGRLRAAIHRATTETRPEQAWQLVDNETPSGPGRDESEAE